jgi:succinate dehydrogenase / fumarate reductase iron-sulfur subunit
MQVKLKVRRFNPESGGDSYFQTYAIEVPDYATILDSLIQVREEVDGSLALRCSCRSAICGSCAMRVDGQARLACKTKVRDLAPEGQEVVVEPLGNMAILKDLVTDMQPFWDKVQAITPWLQPSGPEPEHEYIVPNEVMLDVAGAMSCIMCGACASDCTVLEVDQKFLGPAALAKAYRFVGDPRDGADGDRLAVLSEYGGVWDCTRCNFCVEVCPKGVAPMERILNLRRKAIEGGQVETLGARHTIEFEETTRQHSWLAQT